GRSVSDCHPARGHRTIQRDLDLAALTGVELDVHRRLGPLAIEQDRKWRSVIAEQRNVACNCRRVVLNDLNHRAVALSARIPTCRKTAINMNLSMARSS